VGSCFDLARRVHIAPAMMGLKRPEDFDAWQLAWELKERVFAFTAIPPAFRDFKFCKDIRDSARSAPDNVAEGFYRFAPLAMRTSFASQEVRSAKSEISFCMHARMDI
jgi:hypothetical protein